MKYPPKVKLKFKNIGKLNFCGNERKRGNVPLKAVIQGGFKISTSIALQRKSKMNANKYEKLNFNFFPKNRGKSQMLVPVRNSLEKYDPPRCYG